jgi:hypothetical protein
VAKNGDKTLARKFPGNFAARNVASTKFGFSAEKIGMKTLSSICNFLQDKMINLRHTYVGNFPTAFTK